MKAAAPTVQQHLYGDNWPIRRKVVFAALFYIAVHVSWILFTGVDSQLNRDIGGTLVYAGVGIIMTYCFGALADEWDKRRRIDPPPAADPLAPAVVEVPAGQAPAAVEVPKGAAG